MLRAGRDGYMTVWSNSKEVTGQSPIRPTGGTFSSRVPKTDRGVRHAVIPLSPPHLASTRHVHHHARPRHSRDKLHVFKSMHAHLSTQARPPRASSSTPHSLCPSSSPPGFPHIPTRPNGQPGRDPNISGPRGFVPLAQHFERLARRRRGKLMAKITVYDHSDDAESQHNGPRLIIQSPTPRTPLPRDTMPDPGTGTDHR